MCRHCGTQDLGVERKLRAVHDEAEENKKLYNVNLGAKYYCFANYSSLPIFTSKAK